MADNKNPKLCPKPAYCRFATKCKKVDEKIRKQLKKQGYVWVSLEEFEEEEKFRNEVEETLEKLGYVRVDTEKHLWKLELEKRKVELDIFESRKECPENV